ncbi:conserved hypothetical protein [Gammaproteobacteria bacterium]
MSEFSESPLDQATMLCESITRFNHAVQLRNEMHMRIGKRITFIIRVGMFSMAVVAVAFLLLVLVLSSKIHIMVNAMDIMNGHFTSMADNMNKMNTVIQDMDGNVGTMPTIVSEIQRMNVAMQTLHQSVATISGNLAAMTGNVGRMGGNVARMTSDFQRMDSSVSGIGYDVNTMSQPMKVFDSFRSMMPMSW